MMIFCSRPRFIEWCGTYANDLGFCEVPSEAEQSFEMPDPDLLRQNVLTFAVRGPKHADLTQRARHTLDKVTRLLQPLHFGFFGLFALASQHLPSESAPHGSDRTGPGGASGEPALLLECRDRVARWPILYPDLPKVSKEI